jgi:hypothetical protein
MIEGKVALDATRRRRDQALTVVKQRMLEVSQVFGDIALRDRRLFGDLLRSQLVRA